MIFCRIFPYALYLFASLMEASPSYFSFRLLCYVLLLSLAIVAIIAFVAIIALAAIIAFVASLLSSSLSFAIICYHRYRRYRIAFIVVGLYSTIHNFLTSQIVVNRIFLKTLTSFASTSSSVLKSGTPELDSPDAEALSGLKGL